MYQKSLAITVLMLLGLAACTSAEIDDQKPVIDLTMNGAFPLNCDTLYLGEPFTWKVRFSDNAELGSYSLEIHHNFDHHAHSTDVADCEPEPDKAPVNPFLLIRDFEIPKGSKEFVVELPISLPLSNGEGELDRGDYHFFISLTDHEGWSAQKGLSVKIQ